MLCVECRVHTLQLVAIYSHYPAAQGCNHSLSQHCTHFTQCQFHYTAAAFAELLSYPPSRFQSQRPCGDVVILRPLCCAHAVARLLPSQPPRFGHVVAMSRPCVGHTVATLLPCCDNALARLCPTKMPLCGPCCGYTVVVLWPGCGQAATML